MSDNHESPASTDRLADELKAAVVVAIFGIVALGASEALVARDDTPIARDAEPAREIPVVVVDVPDGHGLPGHGTAEATARVPDDTPNSTF